jgi:xanthosine utilization system XapX-like protein
MKFKAPSFPHYISSLLIAGLIAGLAYALLQFQAIAVDSTIILAVGLVIGHLVGVFSAPSSKTPGKASKQGSKSAGDSEIISLYVGNLAYNARRDSLSDLFSQYGRIKSVRIMTDRETRRPRGYGFVEMEGTGALTAINQLDGTEFCGRTLRVSEANQR